MVRKRSENGQENLWDHDPDTDRAGAPGQDGSVRAGRGADLARSSKAGHRYARKGPQGVGEAVRGLDEATIDRAVCDNPDLPRSFVSDTLQALAEARVGHRKTAPFVPRGKRDDK